MKYILGSLFGVLMVGLTLAPVFAQTDPLAAVKGSDQPIEITSKRFSVKSVPGGTEGTFDGNVKVQQGDLTLTCDRLAVVYDQKNGNKEPGSRFKNLPKEMQGASKIKSITASGNVKLVQGDRTALADKALFDNAKRTITLTGGPPRLWQGRDTVVAETIIIYLDEKRSEFKSDNGGGIKAIITPGQEQEKKEK